MKFYISKIGVCRECVQPKHTAVHSPETILMAKSFVETMNLDYISIMPKSDALTAVKNLRRPSNITTNGIRIVHWDIVRNGNICGG